MSSASAPVYILIYSSLLLGLSAGSIFNYYITFFIEYLLSNSENILKYYVCYYIIIIIMVMFYGYIQ